MLHFRKRNRCLIELNSKNSLKQRKIWRLASSNLMNGRKKEFKEKIKKFKNLTIKALNILRHSRSSGSCKWRT